MFEKIDDYEKMLTFEGSWKPETNLWSTNNCHSYGLNENSAMTITRYDESDFYHCFYDSELRKFPYGAETISVTLFPEGKTTFSYKNNETFDKKDTKEKASSFYEVLDKIKNPKYLLQILTAIDTYKNEMNNPLDIYISNAQLQTLKTKVLVLEQNLKSQVQKIDDYLSSKYVYLNVPFNEKDTASALGARWDGNQKKWYCLKDDVEKFTQWLPEKLNQEEQLDERDL